MNTLSSKCVCGVHDITGEPYAGSSDFHDVHGLAVKTTNGAGPHNIQIFFLSADGTVLHCLLGYWNPDDLQDEAKLAERLNEVWLNPKLTRAQKNAMFVSMQLEHIKEHSSDEASRSHLQGFDARVEAQNPKSDFIKVEASAGGSVTVELKTTDVVIHERMAKRPFMPFDQFDVAAFSNYGLQRYDKNENRLDPERVVQGRRNPELAAERAMDRLDRIFSEEPKSMPIQVPSSVAAQALQVSQGKGLVRPTAAQIGAGVMQARGVMTYNWAKPVQNNVTTQACSMRVAPVMTRPLVSSGNFNVQSATTGTIKVPKQQIVLSVKAANAQPIALRATAMTLAASQSLASAVPTSSAVQELHATAQRLTP